LQFNTLRLGTAEEDCIYLLLSNFSKVHFCLFQRKRKLEELSRQLEESHRKRKTAEQLIAKAKVGREASVNNRYPV